MKPRASGMLNGHSINASVSLAPYLFFSLLSMDLSAIAELLPT